MKVTFENLRNFKRENTNHIRPAISAKQKDRRVLFFNLYRQPLVSVLHAKNACTIENPRAIIRSFKFTEKEAVISIPPALIPYDGFSEPVSGSLLFALWIIFIEDEFHVRITRDSNGNYILIAGEDRRRGLDPRRLAEAVSTAITPAKNI